MVGDGWVRKKSGCGLTNTYLKVLRLDKDLPLPVYATDGSAGIDLYASEYVKCYPESRVRVGTGIAVQIPEGYVGILKSRSGLAVEEWIDTKAGVIDSDYRGEILVCIHNSSDVIYDIERGDKITQMLLIECSQLPIVEVDSLDETVRGSGGFGSTDLKESI